MVAIYFPSCRYCSLSLSLFLSLSLSLSFSRYLCHSFALSFLPFCPSLFWSSFSLVHSLFSSFSIYFILSFFHSLFLPFSLSSFISFFLSLFLPFSFFHSFFTMKKVYNKELLWLTFLFLVVHTVA